MKLAGEVKLRGNLAADDLNLADARQRLIDGLPHALGFAEGDRIDLARYV